MDASILPYGAPSRTTQCAHEPLLDYQKQVVELLSTGVKLPKSYTKKQLTELTSRAIANLNEKESNFVRSAIKDAITNVV